MSLLAKTQPVDVRMTVEEAADYLGIQKQTLDLWRSVGRYEIPYIRVGRLIRYRKSELDAWMEARTVRAGK